MLAWDDFVKVCDECRIDPSDVHAVSHPSTPSPALQYEDSHDVESKGRTDVGRRPSSCRKPVLSFTSPIPLFGTGSSWTATGSPAPSLVSSAHPSWP